MFSFRFSICRTNEMVPINFGLRLQKTVTTTITDRVRTLLSAWRNGNVVDLVHEAVTISAFPLVSGGLHTRGLRLRTPFLRTGTRRVGGAEQRSTITSICLVRQSKFGEGRSCPWGGVRLRQGVELPLNKVVSGTLSKLGRELVTKRRWHSGGRSAKPSSNATDCEGPTYTAPGCVQSTEFSVTAGAGVTENRTNNFAE